MKVLHITANYPGERHPALGVFVRSQVESLRPAGVECAVFDLDGRGNVFRYLWAWMRLLGHLLTHRYDILHAHHALSGVLLCLTGAPLFSRTLLSYQNSPSYEWGRVSFLLLYPFFRRIILKARDEEYCRFKKVRVLPNGCDAQLFRPLDKAECRRRLGLSSGERYLLFADANPRRSARRRSQKREDRFDAVARRLGVSALKLYDVPHGRMPLYYNAADAFLLTSDFEGSPNAVKECLFCNVPVVATPVGDLPFLAQHCPDLYLSRSFSAQELALAVERVLAASSAGTASAEETSSAATPAETTSEATSEASSAATGGGPRRSSSREALLSLGYGLEQTAGRLSDLYREVL